MTAGRVVVLDPAELEALVERAVRQALAEAQPAEPREWLSSDAVAAMLDVHPRTVRKLVEAEGLPARRIGKLLRFRRDEVEAWIDARRH